MATLEITITLTREDGTEHRTTLRDDDVPTKAEALSDPLGTMVGCSMIAGQVGTEAYELLTHNCDGRKDTVPLGHSRN